MTANEARRHLHYSMWASRKILDAALALDREQLNRDLGVSHKSVYATLRHISFGDRIWLSRVLGEPLEPEGAVEIEWPKTGARWETLAQGWSDADLARVVAYRDTSGNAHSSTLQEIVLHVVNHATLHRGQVMAMFRQLGVAPPPTDLMFYFREQNSAHA